jgi:hypothetical protein
MADKLMKNRKGFERKRSWFEVQPRICIEALWKTTKTFRIVGVPTENRTEHLPKPNQDCYRYADALGRRGASPKLNLPYILEVEVSVCSGVPEEGASFGKACDLQSGSAYRQGR